MKEQVKLLLVPIVGMTAMALIFILVVWGGSWYDEVINENGRDTSTAKDLGGYAVLTPSPQCDDSYYPVCGLDGVTYDNACKAVRTGTKIAHRGVCEQI